MPKPPPKKRAYSRDATRPTRFLKKPAKPAKPVKPAKPAKPDADAAPADLTLTGKQRRFLRGLGHVLTPIVQVGKDGITDALVAALEEAIDTHELIKVKLGPNAPDARHDAAAQMATRTASSLVQVLGHTVLLYRTRAEDPTIVLPRK